MASSPKIIVFDDDPTGSQTVRDCLLLLEFSTPNLAKALADPWPLLFLLTNSYFPYSNVVLNFLLGGALGSYPD